MTKPSPKRKSNSNRVNGYETNKGKSHLNIKGADEREVRIDKKSLGWNGVLDAMDVDILHAVSAPVGFVVDIDVKIDVRWNQVRTALAKCGIPDVPNYCPPDGFIATHNSQKIGVWLMPDCRSDFQKLEDFCSTLIPETDLLWGPAQDCTLRAQSILNDAKKQGRNLHSISNEHLIKAKIHTWLAWQAEPGRPLGQAIMSAYFQHDSPQALAFLRWLKELYSLPLDLPEDSSPAQI
ncbi:MAG: DUF3226 domain-containing protein [Gemmataceae bacterium]